MKNVLYVHSNLSLYGSDHCLLEMIKRINRKRYNLFLILPKKNILMKEMEFPLLEEIAQYDIPVYQINVAILRGSLLRNPFLFLYYFFHFIPSTMKFMRIIHQQKIDIIHINTYSILPAGVAGRLCRIPVVWHIREIFPKRLAFRVLSKIIFFLSTKVITVTDTVRKEFFGSSSTSQKIITIYDGVDTHKFYPKNIPTSSLLDGFHAEFIIGTIGRITPLKGHLFFLRAAHEVIKVRPSTHFLIIGNIDNEERQVYQQQLFDFVHRNNLEKNIHFLGFKKNIEDYLNILDLFVLPSILPEALGLVVLEAMACGKPVIATNNGGQKELIQVNKTGFLVAPHDVATLSKLILALVQHKVTAKKMGSMGLQRVRQTFTVAVNVSKIEKVYATFGGG